MSLNKRLYSVLRIYKASQRSIRRDGILLRDVFAVSVIALTEECFGQEQIMGEDADPFTRDYSGTRQHLGEDFDSLGCWRFDGFVLKSHHRYGQNI